MKTLISAFVVLGSLCGAVAAQPPESSDRLLVLDMTLAKAGDYVFVVSVKADGSVAWRRAKNVIQWDITTPVPPVTPPVTPVDPVDPIPPTPPQPPPNIGNIFGLGAKTFSTASAVQSLTRQEQAEAIANAFAQAAESYRDARLTNTVIMGRCQKAVAVAQGSDIATWSEWNQWIWPAVIAVAQQQKPVCTTAQWVAIYRELEAAMRVVR